MGTLNIKFNKYWYKHTLVTLKWRLEYKLQMSKMPWGKIYRHFRHKRLMKRITEMSQRSMHETHESISFSHLPGSAVTLNILDYDIRVHKKDIPEKPLTALVGHVPLFLPPGFTEPPVINPVQLARGLVVPSIGITVMDPTKIYNILPKQMMSELPHIRRRICRLRKRKQWKFHTYHH